MKKIIFLIIVILCLSFLFSEQITINDADSLNIQYVRPFINLFPISILAFAISVDCFAEINDINGMIGKLDDFDDSSQIDDLKKIRSRKIFLGSTSAIFCIINTAISLKRVKIKTDMQYIILSYNF